MTALPRRAARVRAYPPPAIVPAQAPRIGARALLESLVARGVTTIFGYPGGATLPIYDVLREFPIHHVLVRHEQGAAHAADGWSRVTGGVGVAMATSGPGAINLVTGLATAMMDSVPMVAITGNVARPLLGRDAFQETDIVGIAMPITKYATIVMDPDEVPLAVAEAFVIATSGRPGPVLLDFPKDVLQAETSVPLPGPADLRLPGLLRPVRGDVPAADDLVRLIAASERPLILAGHGVQIAGAPDLLREVAERAGIPVAHTLLGIGSLDERHPNSVGYAGMHGWVHANRAIQHCDLLINIGGRFDDRITGKTSTFAPGARIVHVDVDRSEIGKNVRTDLGIVADAGDLLAALLRRLPPDRPAPRREAWWRQLDEWRAIGEARPWHGSGAWREGRLSADYVVEQIGEATDHVATLVSDVGQNQMWAARYYGFRRPLAHLSSGGLGTMGYAVPAAMGAALAEPQHETWAITGDGGFQMTMQELATIVQEQIPLRIAVLNNHKLGMIRQWQEIIYDENYHSAELFGPDLVRLGEAYGLAAFRATRPDEVPGVIAAARSQPGPALVDFHLDEAQNVYPMMLPGRGLSDMVERGPEEPEA
ncbi:MAG TPA: biosynthetic-type acetolactate synthase large subunit [Candidatus Limnocylindrales bacterium]|nr:biosynthetic-type acetolactate synthase large subunit [Candidatus Limnocylindrales bacterium]